MSDKDKGDSTLRARPPWHSSEPPDSRMFRDLLGGRMPETPRLAAAIPPGMRAVGISLSSERALNGMLRVGDHVDVVASAGDANGTSFEGTGRGSVRLAYTILQDLEVLQVGEGSIGRAPGLGSRPEHHADSAVNGRPPLPASDGGSIDGCIRVALAVTPPEAERLIMAAENGAVWLTLLPNGETRNARRVETEVVNDAGGTP